MRRARAPSHRRVSIVDACVADKAGQSDAAYGLLRKRGAPDTIGALIGEYLADAGLGGGDGDLPGPAGALFLTVTFRITAPTRGRE